MGAPRGWLYRLDFASGKSYVGITNGRLSARFFAHRTAAQRGSQQLVHKAWRKYGPPRLTGLARGEGHYLAELERRAIALYGTQQPTGYNLSYGGEASMLGLTHGPVARAKISAAQRGRKKSSETKARIERMALAQHRRGRTMAMVMEGAR